MKVSLIAAVTAACYIPSSFASPLAFDYNKRALHDAQVISGSVQNDPIAFAANNFTHLIIGGGTAGIAVAVRLSEVTSNFVGIIEAGPDGQKDAANIIPGGFGGNIKTKYDWNYTTAASPSGAPSIPWPRGHVLGGSSILNFLVWDRAAKVEYDAWEQLGNPGWNWVTMYKYMKKAEHFTAPSVIDAKKLNVVPVASDYGSVGPVKVSYPRYISEQVQRWIPALVSLGIAKNNQPLGGNNIGASNQPSNINIVNSTRSSSVAAYLAPASGRSNLKVLVSASVTMINLSSSIKGQTATGVNFISGGKKFTASASQKVIVSAGTVNTPAILELSGIGRKSLLQKVGIETKVDNPNVGENLQDHTYTSAAYSLASNTKTFDSLRDDVVFVAQQSALYKANKPSILDQTVPSIGYLTLKQLVGSFNATKLIHEACDYIKTQSNKPYYSTLQKQLDFLVKFPDQVAQMEVIAIDGWFSGSAAPKPKETYITFLAAQQHLLSRGSVHIASANPSVYPTIQPNYFTVPFDLQVLTAGTAYLRKIAASKSYSESYIDKEIVPGNVDLRSYTLKTYASEYHPVGTASMLPRNKGGVVNSNLLVYGTTNVHIVDASIIPLHIAAHIQSTVYGIAEAAADILKGHSLS